MANPLTLVMPLKKGVDLQQLGELITRAQPDIEKALTTIGTVHFASFVVLDASTPNLQPGGPGPYKLAVITSYDGDFDTYIQDFLNNIGEVFDALLSLTTDGGGIIPVEQNVEGFIKYVKQNDASQNPPNSQLGLFSAYPCTVQQVLAADPCPDTATSSS